MAGWSVVSPAYDSLFAVSATWGTVVELLEMTFNGTEAETYDSVGICCIRNGKP